MILHGYVKQYDGQLLTVVAPLDDPFLLNKRQITECDIRLDDGRTISAEQRKKIYATLRDISVWSGHTPEEIKELLKYDFIAATGAKYFSLSNVDMTTAREYLSHIIEFCVVNGIPCEESLLERSPDIERYLYACVLHRRCAICGKKADIHEYDRVGAGRNRNDIHHLGQRVQPLCRIHHRELDDIGQKSFDKKYHLTWVRLDETACRVLGWKL